MKIEFKVADKNYYVVYPSARNLLKAQMEFAKSFSEAVDENIKTREAMDKSLMEQGIWTKENEKEREDLETFLMNGYETLKIKGGIKKSEAKKLALEMRNKRFKLMLLLADKSKYELTTADGIAERNRLNFLIASCCKNEDGTNVFKDVNDYYDKQEEELTMECGRKFAKIYNGYDEDIYKSLPENEFLLKYKFVNDNLDLVNEHGDTVDTDGKLLKEEPKVEFQEFLDD